MANMGNGKSIRIFSNFQVPLNKGLTPQLKSIRLIRMPQENAMYRGFALESYTSVFLHFFAYRKFSKFSTIRAEYIVLLFLNYRGYKARINGLDPFWRR